MPKRGESVEREVSTRRRGSNESTPRERRTTEKEPVEKTVVKKNPLEAKVRKYLEDFIPEAVPNIEDLVVRNIKTDDGDKYDAVFITFTANSDDDSENERENILTIKDLLFVWHTTLQDKRVKGKQLLMEVLPPEEGDEDTPYILTMFETNAE